MIIKSVISGLIRRYDGAVDTWLELPLRLQTPRSVPMVIAADSSDIFVPPCV